MAYRKTAYTRKKTEASRRGLLLAALKLFMTRGYHATSMNQVVKTAGTSIGNAYFYFKNKEDLLMAVVERGMAVRFGAVDALLAEVPEGVQRVAVNAYCVILPPLSGGVVATQSIKSGGDQVFIDRFLKAGMERTDRLLQENLPKLPVEQRMFAARAWCGLSSHVLQGCVLGDIEGSAEGLSGKVVRWQLRALGLTDSDIRKGMKSIDSIHESDHWPQFLATIPRTEEDLERIVMG